MTASPDDSLNLAAILADVAATQPEKDAVIFAAGQSAGQPVWQRQTFGQLAAKVEAYAAGFTALGITPGMRTVLMVRPGLDFLPLTFALFRIGAVPILIDPGMGRGNLLRCIQRTQPEAFVGVSLAHAARVIFRSYFRSVKIHVTIGAKWFWGGPTLADIDQPDAQAPIAPTKASDLAAIIFTTGSTGPPKGVEYTHGMFAAQRAMLQDMLQISPTDVDMPGFALFALFTVMLGCTVVLPDMDPTKPADVTPERIIEAVTTHQPGVSFGSPALWRTVGAHCRQHAIRFDSLDRVVMAGAPVPPDLHRLMLDHVLPDSADIYTPYGATECLPVTCFSGRQVLAETDPLTRRGRGFCVGPALPGVQMKVIRLTDDPIPRFADIEELPPGDIGEVIVQGPMVSRRYFQLPDKTAEHKIYETDDHDHGPFWHRIGDLGYIDDQRRLWMCGRKTHRVETGDQTLYTVCVEAIFNEHPRVYRTALIGIGDSRYRQTPILCVEPMPGEFPGKPVKATVFRHELREIAESTDMTRGITAFLFFGKFPVDIRHNAKIFREKLAVKAAKHPDLRSQTS